MRDYAILTDSSCDIDAATLASWGVASCSLTLSFDGEERQYRNDELGMGEFYDKMRSGGVARTSAVGSGDFQEAFGAVLAQGKDVLYLGFSSGLSNTVNAAEVAARELRAQHPGARIEVVDTLCASAGLGLVVYLATLERDRGATIQEVVDYANETSRRLSHWFTVESLAYLRRGGRVSASAAFAGDLLRIKPVLHVDEAGHLVNMHKARGRRNSIRLLAQKFGELAREPYGTVFISHGDCESEALELADMLRRDYGVDDVRLFGIGPVIGAHSGPGTLALFFVGSGR